MIDRNHSLPITRQAQALGIARSTVCARPRPVSDRDLELMKRIDKLHLEMPFAAQRLKRVFNIDIKTCSECGGDVRIIASIEDSAVIQKILAHLDDNTTSAASGLLPECRAPPSPLMSLFD